MKKLTFKEIITVASMLFGMFFGAGNLIFPASMGQLAGRNMWLAAAGFLITGVGLPLLGVAALGISRKDGLYELAGRVGKPFGLFFTCALYLTIGPFFAIPRCATVSYTVGIQRMFPDTNQSATLAVFSLIFFYRGAFLLPSAGRNSHLDRKGAESAVSDLSCRFDSAGADLAPGIDFRDCSVRCLPVGGIFHRPSGGL